MKACTGLIIFCLAGIQLVQSATLDLSAGTATVTEGTDTVVNVVCTLNPLTALARDAVCALDVETGVATSAENGWDVADVTGYSCTIAAGATTGSVDIPLVDDVVIDTSEILGVTCTASAGDTAGTTASFTINDGGLTDAQMTIVPRNTFYKISEEGTMLSIWVDILDSNLNVAPNEDDINIQFVFPTSVSTDTASTADYDSTVAAITVAGSINGVGTSSFTLDLPVTTDTTVENLETLNVLLSDATTVTSVTADATTTITVHILDDDKPELVIVNHMSSHKPRRSKLDVVLDAFNAVGTWDTFDFSWLPFNLQDWASRDVTTGNGIVVTETTLPRPRYWSRNRFNEYKYSTSQTVSAVPYTLNTYAYVSPTSHSRSRAPIEASVGPTWTVWPTAVDGSGNCVSINQDVISVPFDQSTVRMLRWYFIKDGGTANDIRRLRYYNGKNWIPITACDEAGLYIVSRRGRGMKGWIDFIRVIVAACPFGSITPPACTTPAPTCYNGGMADPELGLCTCPPGFAGTNCETATDPGDFGSSCQFSISDILPGNRRGRCVLFSMPSPFGVTCAAGFYGEDCCHSCPSGQLFGANCAHTCHCADDQCDQYSGVCANGCAPFYFGTNCQSGGPP